MKQFLVDHVLAMVALGLALAGCALLVAFVGWVT